MHGGMAGAFLATDTRLGRPVAVRIVHDEHATAPEFVARFKERVQLAAGIANAHVVRVFDFGIDEDVPYVVTEFVRSKTVEQLLIESTPPPRIAASIAADAAGALQSAHDKGLVHGHLTATLVMVDQTGTTRIGGLGTGEDAADAARLDTIGTVARRFPAFTPEQARGEPAQPRSDIYALGSILYSLLTGESPFEGKSVWSIAYKHVNETLRWPDGVDVPDELRVVVKRAMAKAPEDRYESAVDMQKDLLDFLAASG